jgi:hypothetical protein
MRLKLVSINEVKSTGHDVPGHENEGCYTNEFVIEVLDLPQHLQKLNPFTLKWDAIWQTAQDFKDWPKNTQTVPNGDGTVTPSIAEMLTLYINTVFLGLAIERGAMSPATVESVTRDLRLDKFVTKNRAGVEFILAFTSEYKPKPKFPFLPKT